MIIYEKWNEDNTELLNTIRDPDSLKLSKMKGYLLVVEPVIDAATQKRGEMTFLATERSWAVVEKTAEEIAEYAGAAFNAKVESMTDAVQLHLDSLAQSWGYDNIVSLCSYEGNSDPKYSAEGAAGKEGRSSVWRYCEDELVKIVAGTRAEPESNEAFVAELPTIVRPVV